MEEKNTLVAQVVCFQMLEFETSADVFNSIQIFKREKTSFSKTVLLQREPFLRLFYTFNSSPLLDTKKVFMQTNILSNYQ